MIHLEIMGLPKMYNQFKNLHWAAKAKHNNLWKNLVGAMLLATGQTPAKPFKKARVKMIRHSSAAPDFDNLAQSFKPVMDALVNAGVLENDTMNVVGQSEYGWSRAPSKLGKITVTVEGIE